MKKQVSEKTLELLKDYSEMWKQVFDAVYDDIAEPSIPGGTDIEAMDLASRLVPRPQIF